MVPVCMQALAIGLLLVLPGLARANDALPPTLSAADADVAPTPEAGTLVVYAGTGKSGYSGDDGPATQAQLNATDGLAVDALGNLYIADWENHRVRKVGLDGIISTFAGTGKPGFTGDYGPARRARLNAPLFLAFDAAGNLFISDAGNNRVRKVSPDGIITTVAGGGSPASGIGDGGPALDAVVYTPHGLAVDREGNLFVADWGGLPLQPRVRKVSPEGIITTVAGTGMQGYTGDGGPATKAKLGTPACLAIDRAGNLYITEAGTLYGGVRSRVRKVSPDWIITTVAGAGPSGYSGDGGPATEARLNAPVGVAVDSAGSLFITELLGHRVRKVSPDGIISTVAGGGAALPSLEGAPATAVDLKALTGIALDAAGNLYLSDTSVLGYGSRDWVLKVYGVAAPGLIGGQLFPEPEPEP
jgi:sugar lactone lactonase YvrE